MKSLKTTCLESLAVLITRHIRRMASRVSAAQWFGRLNGQLDIDPEQLIRRQVQLLRDHLWSNIIWYDYNEVFKLLLLAIDDAIIITRKAWKPSSNAAQYRHEMETFVNFTDIALNPQHRCLDFLEIPNSVRARIIENLGALTKLESLILRAPAGGQWLFKSVSKDIQTGLRYLSNLQKFSLKHDCSDDILHVLSDSSGHTLKSLDIESSKQVTDASIGSILICQNIIELNIFNTAISDEGKGRLIVHLPKLTHLPRGDFLCDALGWIDYAEDNEIEPIYLINEFFPSQKYYFHEEWQMEMVAKCCPFITKMFFIFHEDCVPNYLVLLPFLNVTKLELYGGSFYKDRISDLLQVRGHFLTKLTLISIKEIDYRAVAILSIHCPRLNSLALNNCEMVDYRPLGDINSDEEYERKQAFIGMARSAYETIRTFQELEHITIASAAKQLHLVFLLSRCPNLKIINLGLNIGLTDDGMIKVIIQNPLKKLEEFHCERNLHLTMTTVNLLVNNCDKLKAISDLQCWTALDPNELSKFREMIRLENLNLDTRSHQKLRKYLDMREFERRTYINLVAGPSMERLRMAERLSHAV